MKRNENVSRLGVDEAQPASTSSSVQPSASSSVTPLEQEQPSDRYFSS